VKSPRSSDVQDSRASGSPPVDTATTIGKPAPESAALTVGGIAALLTGACCVLPLVLISVGLGGAWLANLQLLEPYRPLFITIALLALVYAGWRLYRPAIECDAANVCAAPQAKRARKIGFGIVAMLLLITFSFPYLAPLLY